MYAIRSVRSECSTRTAETQKYIRYFGVFMVLFMISLYAVAYPQIGIVDKNIFSQSWCTTATVQTPSPTLTPASYVFYPHFNFTSRLVHTTSTTLHIRIYDTIASPSRLERRWPDYIMALAKVLCAEEWRDRGENTRTSSEIDSVLWKSFNYLLRMINHFQRG